MANPVVTPIDDPIMKGIATITESFAGNWPSITINAGEHFHRIFIVQRSVAVPPGYDEPFPCENHHLHC